MQEPFGATAAQTETRAARHATAAPAWPESGLRSRLFGRHVSPELLGLWVIEVLVCMLLIYGLLASGPHGALPSQRLHAADQAAALALTFGLTSVAVGLYSPEAYLRTRRLLVESAIGALLGLPAVWLVSHAVGIDMTGLAGANPRLALLALAVWALLLCVLRLAFSYALRGNLFVRRVLIIGAGAEAARLAGAIGALRRGFFEVTTVAPAGAAMALAGTTRRRTAQQGRRLWGVIVTGGACDTLAARQLLRAREQGLRLYSDTAFWERELRRIDIDQVGPDDLDLGVHMDAARATSTWPTSPGLTLPARGGAGRLEAAVHRLSDIVLSLTLLSITLPLMLLTAMLVIARQSGAGALPPGARRAARPRLHAAEVPQHACRCRGARPGLGHAARPARHPRRLVHPPHPHRRAAAAVQRAARPDELHRPASGAAAFRFSA